MLEQPNETQLQLLIEKRIELIKELLSDQHYDDTQTVSYGSHDPFEVPIARCDTCDSPVTASSLMTGKKQLRWTIECRGCGKQTAQHQKEQWQAALMWNGINLGTQRYQDLPLFGLGSLSPQEAGIRVSGIRHNLELRIKLCCVDRAVAIFTKAASRPGHMFQLRLEAYLKWAMHAHRLTKFAKARD